MSLSPTTTTLAASVANPLYGQAETFTVTVAPASGGGTPTGTVTFYDKVAALGTVNLSTSGGATTASLTTATLNAGPHSIVAIYSGNAAFGGSSAGGIRTIAGTGVAGVGGDGGPATATPISDPTGVAVDAQGNVFFTEQANGLVREVLPDGTLVTVAGGGNSGLTADGVPATDATLDHPVGIAVDAQGNVFFTEYFIGLVREVRAADHTIVTVAGGGTSGPGVDDIPATSAQLDQPGGLAVDAQGNLYFSEFGNHNVVREVRTDGTIVTIAGTGVRGPSTTGIPATSSMLDTPRGVAVDSSGNVFFGADANSVYEIRASDCLLIRVAYDPPTFPSGVAVDPQGNVFYGSQSQYPSGVREVIRPPSGTFRLPTTVAGNGPFGYNGDGIPATTALVGVVGGVAVDAQGNVFLADRGNQRVRLVTPSLSLVVQPAVVNLTLNPPPSSTYYYGDPVTMTVNAAVVAPGAGDPLTTLNFGAGLAPLVMSGGTGSASLTTMTIPVGTYPAWSIGVYAQSSNFALNWIGPNSFPLTILPDPPTSTTVAIATPDPVAGLPMTVRATVANNIPAGQPARPTPIGTVTFYDGATTLGTATLDSSGVATLPPVTAPAAGQHLIRAIYSGTASYPIYPPSSSIDGRVSTVAAPGAGGYGAIAIDGAGNLFTTGNDGRSAIQIRPDGTVTTVATGFIQGTVNVAADRSGNLFVAGEVWTPSSLFGAQTVVYERRPDGTTSTIFTDDLPRLTFFEVPLAVDGVGNVFVAPGENSLTGRTLYEIPTNGRTVALTTPIIRSAQLAADGAGRLFVWNNGQPLSIVQADGTLAPIVNLPGPSRPWGLAVDGADNLFLTDSYGQVYEARLDGTYAPLTVGPPSSSDRLYPSYLGMAVDGAGNLLLAGYNQYYRVDVTTPNLTVRALATSDVQSLLTQQGGTVTLRATSADALANVLSAISGLSATTTGSISVALVGGATYQQLDSSGNTVPFTVSAPAGVTLSISSPSGDATVYDLQATGGNVDIHGTTQGGITIVGLSPALTVRGGSVTVGAGVTLVTRTTSPTILVTGGTLTISGATIRGTSELIHNAGPNPVSALGNTFVVNGATLLVPSFALEDAIYDYLDDPRVGSVTVDTSGNAYVTASSGTVQRGVDVAAAGGTVFVQDGVKGNFTVGTKPLTIAFQGGPTLALGPDPLYAGTTALTIIGTPVDDKMAFNSGTGAGDVAVTVNSLSTGTFHPTGRVVAHGGAGNDDVQVAGSITLPTWLYGEGGNDRLKGGSGNNVILGGAGDDLLVGNSNRDLLIGGLGADRIVGNEQDDILIAGSTAFDVFDNALAAILAEWTSTRSYSTRVSNLMGTGTGERANGLIFLITDGASATVFDDGVADVLTGDTGLDWFLFNVDGDGDAKKKDKVTDLTAQEFTSDLDFITAP